MDLEQASQSISPGPPAGPPHAPTPDPTSYQLPTNSNLEPATSCPTSFAQERLWFMNQLDPDPSAYNFALTFHVTGPLDEGALERALNRVVQRHEALRTTFDSVEGELRQIVHPFTPFQLPIRPLAPDPTSYQLAAADFRPPAFPAPPSAQPAPPDSRTVGACPSPGQQPGTRNQEPGSLPAPPVRAGGGSSYQQVLNEEAGRPFDLRAGPLFRAILWRVTPDEHLLMLSVHQIISDGWSFNILRREMGALYEQEAGITAPTPQTEGTPSAPPPRRLGPCAPPRVVGWGTGPHQEPGTRNQQPGTRNPEPGAGVPASATGPSWRGNPLPDLPIQVADHARWQREWLTGEAIEHLFAYWKDKLGSGGGPSRAVLDLPTDWPRPAVRSSNGAVQRIVIPERVVARVNQLAQAAGCTPFMVHLAAYNALLHRFTGQTDIWVGTPIAGRIRPEIENLIGCFINTLVLRTDLSPPAPTTSHEPVTSNPNGAVVSVPAGVPASAIGSKRRGGPSAWSGPSRRRNQEPGIRDQEPGSLPAPPVRAGGGTSYQPPLTFSGLLHRVRDTVVDAFDHQDMPFEALVEKLNVPRDRSRNPLFQAMIIDSSTFVQPLVIAPSEQPTSRQPGPPNRPQAAQRPQEAAATTNKQQPATSSQQAGTRNQQPLVFAPIAIERGASMVDMTLFLVGSDEGLKVGLEYSTDLFRHDTATRFLRAYLTLLESAVSDPDQAIDGLCLLTEAERHKLLVEWNATASDYPKDLCVHQLFEQQAARTPEAIAASFEGREITYRALGAQAELLAAQLREKLHAQPTQPGTRNRGPGTTNPLIAVFVERSLEMLVAILGVAKAGCAYVPLDPDYPEKRIAYILEDAQAKLIVTQSHLAARLPNQSAGLLIIDDARPSNQEPTTRNRQPATSNQQPATALAYVIYTSGSTGNPKGVQISHGALVNLLCSMQKEPGLSAEDTLAAVTTLCFDIAGLELWLPLITGAKVVIVSREAAMDGARLSALLEAERVSVMQATPATWRILLEAGWQGGPIKALCGGESLPASLAKELLSRTSQLWNVYGPTETTIWSTLLRITDPEAPITIGRPIANTRLYILDANQEPTPIGVPGELYIGGDGLAKGYQNRPDLTAEKFVEVAMARPSYQTAVPHGEPGTSNHQPGDSPVWATSNQEAGTSNHQPATSSQEPGISNRLYRTGDLARWLPDGTVEFLGRLDHQVKVRGFRIELGEIEARLRALPGVEQARVIAREDTPGDRELVAYLVAGEAAPDWPQMRLALAEDLPDYMLPAACVKLDSLLLTPNGKLDQQALPPPDRQRPVRVELARQPTDTEAALIPIWERVLHVSPIAVRDDFFALGGHSLTAVRLFSEIERAFGMRLPLSILFQAPTIEQLAAELAQPAGSKAWSTLVAINPSGARPAFFCVHAVGANVLNYRLLSSHLGEDQPFYGFQARGLDGELPPLGTVEEMAEQYLTEVRRIQPTGPYLLGGASSGGTVAFEMAQQLAARGETVALVAMMDTMIMDHQWPERCAPRSGAHARMRSLDRFLGEFVDLPPGEQARFVWTRLLGKFRRSEEDVRAAGSKTAAASLPESIDSLKWSVLAAMRRYQPKPYDGPVAMFLTEDAPYRTRFDLRLLWAEYAMAGLEVHTIPGDHGTFLDEPHVAIAARRLSACLDRAIRRQPGR
ncbi:MAG TPA: amino acid adenylation domain-containing protein [Chloroflexota bacterium]|nr:amino acid adenylation domain-containing protein [Chloroflexota bacterium]